MAIKDDHKEISKQLLENELGTSVTVSPTTVVSKEENNVINAHEVDVDDEFEELYVNMSQPEAMVIRPPYDPKVLKNIVTKNNTVGQCIQAMEVNIDGTGYAIEPPLGTERDEADPSVLGLTEFFDEPYPGESFLTMRRKLRVDMESVGYGYLAVLRTTKGELTFLQHIRAENIRMLRLTGMVPIEVQVRRMGEDKDITLNRRPRRYVQRIGKELVYFKEYGVPLDLNRETGEWAPLGTKLPANLRASELLMFSVLTDHNTPYGVPRWITQTPSVLGSRKSEEFNLDFFNAGGLPPALVMVQGGAMTEPTRNALKNYLSGQSSEKHRAVVVEVFSVGGDLGKGGGNQVKVDVHTFGDRQNDAMFQKYDERCELRVRSSFRLPQLFIGRSEDTNYASANIAYQVAEAQVFQPERQEFDEVITNTIVKELAPGYRYRSLPVSTKDVTVQLAALTLLKGAITNEELVAKIGEVTKLSISVDSIIEAIKVTEAQAIPGQQVSKLEVQKSDPSFLVELANDWSCHVAGTKVFADDSVRAMQLVVVNLQKQDRDLFDSYVTVRVMDSTTNDLKGVTELCSAACDIIGHEHDGS